MNPNLVTVSDFESNNSNRRLQEVLQLALDLNIEAEAILSSIDLDKLGFEPEVECVGEIRVVSRDSIVPRYSDRSLNSGLNAEGVFVAHLPRTTRKKRVDRCLRSSKLDPENNPDSILTQEDFNNIVSIWLSLCFLS